MGHDVRVGRRRSDLPSEHPSSSCSLIPSLHHGKGMFTARNIHNGVLAERCTFSTASVSGVWEGVTTANLQHFKGTFGHCIIQGLCTKKTYPEAINILLKWRRCNENKKKDLLLQFVGINAEQKWSRICRYENLTVPYYSCIYEQISKSNQGGLCLEDIHLHITHSITVLKANYIKYSS